MIEAINHSVEDQTMSMAKMQQELKYLKNEYCKHVFFEKKKNLHRIRAKCSASLS